VGGLAFGCREAALTIEANAFIQPGHYFWVYLAVPVLGWMMLGILLLLACATVVRQVRRDLSPRAALALYVALIAFAGTLSVTTDWIATVSARLTAVGNAPSAYAETALWVVALAIATGAALAGSAVAASSYGRRCVSWLPHVLRAVVLILVILCVPAIHFFATDWKWAIGLPAARGGTASAPNMLLISIDTLRADHLGCYGNDRELTPHIDRLARGGTLFEQAITSSPWTLPAVASILTGLYPDHHGAGKITNGRTPLGRSALPAGSWTLARTLRERGYRTQAIVTNPYLALQYNLGQGFDGYENMTIESEAVLSFADTTVMRLAAWLAPGLLVGDRGDAVSRHALRWLSRARARAPFFLWVHYIDPHAPYSRPGTSRHKSMRGDLSVTPASGKQFDLMLSSPDVARLRSGEIRLTAKEKEEIHDLYRGEVASVDAAVGTVLDALDRLGLRDRTLVILVADHGEEFWEHGGVEHGHTVYEELVRVPLIIRWPGHVRAGVRIASQVSVTDIAPSVLDLLRLPLPPGLDGVTMVPALRGEQSASRPVLIENMLFAEERTGLRIGGYKYVRWANGKEEVYNLSSDPAERTDLAGVTAVADRLRGAYARVEKSSWSAAQRTVRVAPDQRTEAALRALGYLH